MRFISNVFQSFSDDFPLVGLVDLFFGGWLVGLALSCRMSWTACRFSDIVAASFEFVGLVFFCVLEPSCLEKLFASFLCRLCLNFIQIFNEKRACLIQSFALFAQPGAPSKPSLLLCKTMVSEEFMFFSLTIFSAENRHKYV